MGYYERTYDNDGNPEHMVYVKEEPDCGACNDAGVITVDLDNGGAAVENCPDCNPTQEQRAAQLAETERINAEWRAAVERGDIDPEDAPF